MDDITNVVMSVGKQSQRFLFFPSQNMYMFQVQDCHVQQKLHAWIHSFQDFTKSLLIGRNL